MRKIAQSIDYMSKDYKGFRKMMIEAIPTIIPEWSDFSEDDFGIALIELLSYGLDILSYYQDKINNELFLSTSKTRKAVIDICNNILGYTLKPAVPSRYLIVFKKLEEFRDQEKVIPAGTIIGTDPALGGQVIFEVDSTLVIPAGSLGNEKNEQGNYLFATTATHGKTLREELGYGTGKVSQKITLAKTSVIVDTLKVWTVENGIIRDWVRVNDFLDSTFTDRHYLATSDENKVTTIEFGDGLSGMKPNNTFPLYATYRVGGGTIGNVGINKINSFVSSEIVGIDTICNPEQPLQYGTNTESLNSAKILAPRIFKTNERAVTVSDFEAFACKVPGVLRAKCIETFNENGDILIYISTADRGETSEQFKDLVKQSLKKRSLVNVNIIIKDAEYLDFDIDVALVTYSDYANSYVKSVASNVISSLLSIDNFDFNEEITRSMINKELMTQDCIYDVMINTPKENIQASEIQIPRLRNINITVSGGVD